MRAWLHRNFSDPKAAFASAMAIAGGIGVLCCCGVIIIFTMLDR